MVSDADQKNSPVCTCTEGCRGAEKYPIWKAELGVKPLTSQNFVCLTVELLTLFWRKIEVNVPQLVAIATNFWYNG